MREARMQDAGETVSTIFQTYGLTADEVCAICFAMSLAALLQIHNHKAMEYVVKMRKTLDGNSPKEIIASLLQDVKFNV